MELNELIESIDIVEYISQFVDLEKRGDEYWGLSCFKEEKTPSFSVRPSPPRFFDYSSGIGGNVYTFVRYYFHCGGRKAVEILKKYAGITEVMVNFPAKLDAFKVCKRFAPQKIQTKASTATILPDDYMERFEKSQSKLAVWESEGISRASLDKFQVYYDSFSDRLVYPVRNPSGKIVNIGGRTLDPNWKEKNLRKYNYYYHWGTIDTIYGLYENREAIRAAHEIILFEGCKSVLLADSWGIHNTGAILTSHLNPNQLKILVGLGCNVVFATDNDVDIKKDHNIERLKRYVNVEYIKDRQGLLAEKDSPVDKGQEVFNQLYEERMRYR